MASSMNLDGLINFTEFIVLLSDEGNLFSQVFNNRGGKQVVLGFCDFDIDLLLLFLPGVEGTGKVLRKLLM